MKVFIGSVVVCHILSGAPTQAPDAQNEKAKETKQMTGTVKEIFKEDVIETGEDNIPVRKKKTMFMVLLNEEKGLIKIGAQACLPVLSEKEYKQYQEEKSDYLKSVVDKKTKVNQKNKEVKEVDSKQKQDLLDSLEEK